MKQKQLVEYLAVLILKKQKDSPLLVGIDGIDASGKTTLANHLASELRKKCSVIRAAIDGFHNPQEIRYARGKNSPEGCYFDSFNYNAMKEFLLDPLKRGEDRALSQIPVI